jgi:Glycosyltransferase family 87
MSPAGRTSSPSLWLLVGVLSLAGGVVISLYNVGGGVDFPVLYVMGQGLLRGENVYAAELTAAFPTRFGVAPSGMYYPPATAFAVAPLALMPYTAAKWAFASVIVVVLVTGIRALVSVAAPNRPPHWWMIAAAIVLISAAMRWGTMLLQVAPLIFGLLCWFVSLSFRGRERAATAVAILAVVLKVTLSLPFVGLLFLRRRWGSLVLVGVAWAALSTIGFWRMGPEAVPEYRRSVADLGGLNTIDSPDLWDLNARPRLDWIAGFYSLTKDLTLSRLSALALTVACGVWLAWMALRSRASQEEPIAIPFLGALVCVGSLSVYHHQYDAILLFAPAILVVLKYRPEYRIGAALVVPILVMMLLLPIGRTERVLMNILGSSGSGLLKLAFPIAFTVALVGFFQMLRRMDLDN